MKFSHAIASVLMAAAAPSSAPSTIASAFLLQPSLAPPRAACPPVLWQSSPLVDTSAEAEGADSEAETTSAVAVVDVPPSSPAAGIEGMPSHSPATSLPNRVYSWRGYDVRYQVSGPEDADRAILLVHGLFVNSDHWRRTLTGLHDLAAEKEDGSGSGSGSGSGKTIGTNTRVYALDLLGCGWSSKPSRDDPDARAVDGENGRFADCDSVCYRGGKTKKKVRTSSVLENVPLGTPAGGNRVAPRLELRHPLGSPYNFYTWAEQVADFARDVIHEDIRGDGDSNKSKKKVTLVANSIGTMSSLQSMIDEPDLFDGCLVINPNFRELHMAEVPLSPLAMPLVRQVQSLLREKGHGLFESLATPETVAKILEEPYAVTDAIDDDLVTALLDPLLTKGADDVVFDTLSYSAGPLPEQQLSSPDFPEDSPVWVAYGTEDPWTPPRRVENLKYVCGRPGGGYGEGPVERIVGLEGAGHCPHDEVPDEVNRLILDFLERLDS